MTLNSIFHLPINGFKLYFKNHFPAMFRIIDALRGDLMPVGCATSGIRQ